MYKLLLSFTFLLFLGNIHAQHKISGYVKSSQDDKDMFNADVYLEETGKTVSTDRIGYFQFVDLQPGTYHIVITKEGYDAQKIEVEVVDGDVEVPTVSMVFNPTNIDAGVITLTDDELDSDQSSTQSAVGLLQASRDVFVSAMAFELGAYWFRIRGYDNKYNDVLFNGVRMNKTDNGRVEWSNWGGLNDITRYPAEVQIGLDPSEYTFGGVGGVTSFDTKPSNLRKGVSLSYSLTNRSYRQRVMATYNSGLSEKGWAFTFSGSRRWAEEGIIDGTFYDAWGYYLGIEKRINENHTLVFTGFGAPNRRSSNAPMTQEIYDLKDENYNPYWGWQDGDKRNERIRRTHEPIGMLKHEWKIDDKSKLSTTVAYQIGKDERTRLDWYNANNPSPIYYRKFPSWYRYAGASQEVIDEVVNQWQNNENYYQLNWTDLYRQNANANQTGAPAAYVLANDVNEDQTFSFYTQFETELSEKVDLIAAATFQKTTSDLYRKVDDALGANFVANRDDFANPGESGEFDERNPGRLIREGDRFQYDFDLHHQRAEVFVRTDIDLEPLQLTLSMKVSQTDMYRDGQYQHFLYANNSFGKSETHTFRDFGIKTHLVYKLDGRNYLQLNAGYFTNAPTTNQVFPNGRSNDLSIPDIESAKVLSGDLSYIIRAPKLKARATAFYTEIRDETDVIFGFADRSNPSGGTGSNDDIFGAWATTGIDMRHIGGELAVDYKLSSTVNVFAVASIGEYVYTDDAETYVFVDDQLDDLGGPGRVDFGTANIEDYKVAAGPQQGFTLGFQYRSPKYWWAGASGNYLMNNYNNIVPLRRTNRFITNQFGGQYPDATDARLAELLAQEQFSDEFMINLNFGKTFRFGEYYMGISLGINNILDNRDYITGGFEQTRLGDFSVLNDPGLRDVFGTRFWVDRGRSYFLNVFLRF